VPSQRPGMAVAALVLGIAGIVLCFIFIPSLLALIFGLVAAKRIRQSNGALTGTGLARAGWILGLIGLVIGASFVTAAVLGAFDDDDVALSDLEVGMCANLADLEGEVSSVPTVDCTEPHDAELTFIGQLNADGVAEYPGVSEVRATVEQECAGESFTDYVGTNYDDSEFDINFVFPNEEAWDREDGEYICFLFTHLARDLTSSVRGSGR
jgi:hypothetical protein